MEPLAHTLFGAALGRAATPPGSRSAASANAGPSLVVVGALAANLPDVDVLAYLGGSDFALGFRRGWTHGVLAMAVWPALTVLLVASWRARRRGTGWTDQLSRRLLAVVGLGCLSHPLLDWLNNYGVRLLMPFDGRWFYGDVAFIVDPWMWLLLGGGLVLSTTPSPRARRGWIVLAVLTGLAVGLSPAPPVSRGLWLLGLLAVVVTVARRPIAADRRPVWAGLALFVVYVASLSALERAARGRVIAELELADLGRPVTAQGLMVGPTPMNPVRWQVVARHGDHGYRVGELSLRQGLAASEVLPVTGGAFAPGESPAEIEEAWRRPEVAGFAAWVRFPFSRVVSEEAGRFVYLLDARYTREPTTLFGGARVPLAAGD